MGTTDSLEWTWLQAEVRAAAANFSAQLGTVSDTSARVPNLTWSVAELSQHLISLPHLYQEQNRLDRFEPPADWPEFSRSVRAHITETSAKALGERLRAEMEIVLEELAPDPDAPRVLYGQQTTAANTAGGLLGELLMHGMDLGRLTGAEVTMQPRQANAIIGQAMALAPVFVDQAKARKLDGTYHLKFRGGDAYTYLINDGLLTVERGAPAKADAHLNADPVAFVLLSLGRMSQIKAGLQAKVLVYGRKPWRLARLSSVVVDGV